MPLQQLCSAKLFLLRGRGRDGVVRVNLLLDLNVLVLKKQILIRQKSIVSSLLRSSCFCFKQKEFDPDVIRTRSLLIWSQTRYRCATESSDVTARIEQESKQKGEQEHGVCDVGNIQRELMKPRLCVRNEENCGYNFRNATKGAAATAAAATTIATTTNYNSSSRIHDVLHPPRSRRPRRR